MITPGNIILLNGASSAGKTSILLALQQVLDTPCGMTYSTTPGTSMVIDESSLFKLAR